MRVKRITLSGLSATLLTLGLALAFTLPASAQTADDGSFNLVTSPLPINLSAKPGTSVSTDIRVKNGGTKTERLKVSLMKFGAYGEEGKPSIADRAPGDDYFDWVTFTPSVFDAPPNEWKTVKMTIKIPKTAAFGYYYAATFSRATTIAGAPKQNVLVGSTAVLALLDVDSPNAKRELKITSVSIDRKWYEFLPATMTIKFHNSGNTHLIPKGTIYIKHGSSQLAVISMNPSSGNILPNTNRIFKITWKDGFPVYEEKVEGDKTVLDKNDKPVNTLKWDFTKVPKLRIGRYTANLLVSYDDGKKDVPLEASVSFWVMPWRLLGGLLVVVLFVGVGFWSTGNRLYKRMRNKSKK